jgi:ABC-type multidrug transport system ATPase subunit
MQLWLKNKNQESLIFSNEENIEFFANIHNITNYKEREEELLTFTNLLKFKKRLANDLSGGMKQKLALCCALIHKPKVLFLDEPTTGVDPVSRKEFWEMLKRLQQKGITILVSTPYMDEAALCDRIALIQDGKILEIDTPEDIVKHYPKKIYDVKADDMYELILELNKYEHHYSVYPFGEFVHYTDQRVDFDLEELKEYLHKKGLKNIFIKATQTTIEDAFMELAK